jgi:polyferredoxin
VPRLQRVRTAMQVTLVLLAAAAGIGYARGWSRVSVESFCPFGGLETAWSFVTRRTFSCTAGELNLSLLVALLALTLVARKAFCGWVCPVGALHELLAHLARRSRLPLPWSPRPALDRLLRWLRVPVLVLVLAATWTTGEMVFRGYDPYYVLFSAHGEDVRAWSYALLAGVLLLGALVPMAWCRWLCPLGVTLTPFAWLGRLRLARTAGACGGCRACSRACPQGIDVAGTLEVRSAECTLCLACTGRCPGGDALTLRLEGTRR